jgi:hypothetical protein
LGTFWVRFYSSLQQFVAVCTRKNPQKTYRITPNNRPLTAATGVRTPYGMPKQASQTIRIYMQGARRLLPRAVYVVYAMLVFGQLMINC